MNLCCGRCLVLKKDIGWLVDDPPWLQTDGQEMWSAQFPPALAQLPFFHKVGMGKVQMSLHKHQIETTGVIRM